MKLQIDRIDTGQETDELAVFRGALTPKNLRGKKVVKNARVQVWLD